MSNERVLCAGFGGQGVMSIGQLLAYAGMLEDKQVTWMPSYGPEMRGGTAYCSVVISDRQVGSPIVTTNASSGIIMNLPSLDRFEESIVQGGLLLVNSSLIQRQIKRRDIRVYAVPANELATECGNPKAANMVMLGAYLAITGAVSIASVIEALPKVFGAKAEKMQHLNIRALWTGAAFLDQPAALRKAA